jgi:AraC-like DNA-binding protein
VWFWEDEAMADLPASRHLLRARDFADAHYTEPITVADMARQAGQSPAHFSQRFRHTFGESPHQYLLTRRLERAAALLRLTDWSVARICMTVGLSSVGSFTTSFKRMYLATPTEYRDGFPPAAAHARIPLCLVKAHTRPKARTFREDPPPRIP